jgi:polyribonucleotide nucleotidyltransferase
MVAGIAMGLVLDPSGRFAVLTDILGSEDSLGDMDFKVAGDAHGITAFQMDIKVEGITLAIMAEALKAAGAGRRHILARMGECAPPPSGSLSLHAPRISSLTIPVDKIGALIGPGGRTARAIQDATGVELQVEQDGEVVLKGPSDEALAAAAAMVVGLTSDPEVGAVYRGARVVTVAPFGAFVEIMPKREGLLHVSEWDVGRTANIADVVKEGDLVDVMLVEVQEGSGKLKLSRRALLVADGKAAAPPAAEGGGAPAAPRVDIQVGAVFRGARVASVASFGAFVEVAPGQDGLLHVSEWDARRTENIADVVREGDAVDVVVIDIQPSGKFKLSRRALAAADAADAAAALAPPTPPKRA